ncbi:hypothetical protein D3C79_681350 [compost metagenome]
MATAAGLIQHELDIRHGLQRVDHVCLARVHFEDVHDPVGLALFDHGQASLPRHEFPLQLDTQAPEHLSGDFVIYALGLAVVLVHIRRPVIGNQAQAFGLRHGAQACEQQDA